MIIHRNFPLREYNTFGIEAYAAYFIEFYDTGDIIEYLESELAGKEPVFILGGGSNVLFTSDFDGLVIHSAITGIKTVQEDETHVYLKAGSGIVWDELVDYCTTRNLGGLENLSDIPGLVGAAPVQNIGAYGVEAADSIFEVIAWNFNLKKEIHLSNTDCKFSYRNSIFKEVNQYNLFISHVVFKLSKKPILNTSYGPVAAEFSKYSEKNIRTLRQSIINIRRSKLPAIEQLPSAGSFFKNPVISSSLVEELSKKYPEIPVFPQADNSVKVPAAWLIEQTGLKGIRHGAVGTYEKQPLVIVNFGNAQGKDIVNFAKFIQEKVKEKFAIDLEPEVCFV